MGGGGSGGSGSFRGFLGGAAAALKKRMSLFLSCADGGRDILLLSSLPVASWLQYFASRICFNLLNPVVYLATRLTGRVCPVTIQRPEDCPYFHCFFFSFRYCLWFCFTFVFYVFPMFLFFLVFPYFSLFFLVFPKFCLVAFQWPVDFNTLPWKFGANRLGRFHVNVPMKGCSPHNWGTSHPVWPKKGLIGNSLCR